MPKNLYNEPSPLETRVVSKRFVVKILRHYWAFLKSAINLSNLSGVMK